MTVISHYGLDQPREVPLGVPPLVQELEDGPPVLYCYYYYYYYYYFQ